MDNGADIVILDVRTGMDYDRSSNKIKGAVRVSIFQLEEKYRELPRDREIITYCT
jgi:rhodanese-related sulfurtransferase